MGLLLVDVSETCYAEDTSKVFDTLIAPFCLAQKMNGYLSEMEFKQRVHLPRLYVLKLDNYGYRHCYIYFDHASEEEQFEVIGIRGSFPSDISGVYEIEFRFSPDGLLTNVQDIAVLQKIQEILENLRTQLILLLTPQIVLACDPDQFKVFKTVPDLLEVEELIISFFGDSFGVEYEALYPSIQLPVTIPVMKENTFV